jgi:hypothetical protein
VHRSLHAEIAYSDEEQFSPCSRIKIPHSKLILTHVSKSVSYLSKVSSVALAPFTPLWPPVENSISACDGG